MKFTAVGDVIIGRRIENDFKGYAELATIINKGDAKFFNLETTLNYAGECFASQVSGGTYLRVVPEILDDVKKFGFNMTSFNNNHVMDFSFGGLLSTLKAVEESGLVHSGVGKDLDEASAPAYLETENGTVALISVNSSLKGQMEAGMKTDRMPGRPGVNPLRVSEYVEVKKEDFEHLKRVIDDSGINIQLNIEKREGYHGGVDNTAEIIGGLRFISGNATRHVRRLDQRDLDRVKVTIDEAKKKADYIMVSLHSHEMGKAEKEEPAEFLEEFAHFCIDNGANAVIGHGPHLLRPVEIYKECPIFYSLGDFVLELYDVEYAPEEFFAQYGLSSKKNTVYELLKTRSKNFTIGLMTDKRMFQSVIPYWETENGKLKSLIFYPVELCMDRESPDLGLPRLAKNADFMDGFIKRSQDYGTHFMKNEDGSFSVRL